MSLSTLRTRLETATEADQAEVLEMAFDVFLPDPIASSSEAHDYQWLPIVAKFDAFIAFGAHTDAALLIMREVLPGCLWRLGHDVDGQDPSDFKCNLAVGYIPSFFHATHSPESLAIIAAVCAAKGDDDANPIPS